MAVKLEDFLYLPLSCFLYHEECKLLVDVVVALLVGLAKIAPGHGFSDSEMIDLACMSFQSNDEIPKALTI